MSDVVNIVVPSSGNVNVENGTIYVKVFALGDTPRVGGVYAVTHSSASPSGDAHNIGDELTENAGVNQWGGRIPAPLGNFRVSACAQFEDKGNEMSSHHVPTTSVQFTGVEA